MSIARFIVYCLGALLLVGLGAGYYYYRNFPALVEQQARHYLQDYGVDKLDYSALKIRRDRITAGALALRGEYNGLVYRANLIGLAVHFDWRTLPLGQVHSIRVDNIDLELTESDSGASSTAPASVDLSEFLPRAYLELSPADAVTISRWQLAYDGQKLPVLNAQGSLLIGKQLQLQLTTQYEEAGVSASLVTREAEQLPHITIALDRGDKTIINLAIGLSNAGKDSWSWLISADTHLPALLSWLQHLKKSGEETLDFDALDALAISGDTHLDATVQHENTMQLAELTGQSPWAQFTVDALVESRLEHLTYQDIVSDLQGNLDFSLSWDSNAASFVLAPTKLQANLATAVMSLSAETQTWLRWDETLPVQWHSPNTVSAEIGAVGDWRLKLADSTLSLGNKASDLKLQGMNLELAAEAVAIDQAVLKTNFSSRLSARLSGKPMPLSDITLSQQGSIDNSTFEIQLADVAESMSLSLTGKGDPTTGRATLTTSLLSPDLGYASSTVLPLLQSFGLVKKRLAIEISQGSLQLDSDLTLRSYDLNGLTQHSRLILDGVSGQYEEYQFEDLSLRTGWSGVDQWRTTAPAELQLGRLNIGFDLIDTQARLSLPNPTSITSPVVKVEVFSSGTFGGRIYLPEPRIWDFGADSNTFTLKAENWHLADLVALQQDQDIRAQGLLEGELPVTLQGGRVIIANGYLRAIPPGGTINYVANESSKALAASSSELALALDLLSDFQFEVLSSKVQLDEVGNLMLGLSLAGKNPSQYDGRPVNFNINLEQNLDPLLQSLRLSDKLVEELEGRIN